MQRIVSNGVINNHTLTYVKPLNAKLESFKKFGIIIQFKAFL
jgi:hypothetical protein